MSKTLKDHAILPWVVMLIGLAGCSSALWLLHTFITGAESDNKWAALFIIFLIPLHLLNLACFCGFAGFTIACYLWREGCSPNQSRVKMTSLITGTLWVIILIGVELRFPLIRGFSKLIFSQLLLG